MGNAPSRRHGPSPSLSGVLPGASALTSPALSASRGVSRRSGAREAPSVPLQAALDATASPTSHDEQRRILMPIAQTPPHALLQDTEQSPPTARSNTSTGPQGASGSQDHDFSVPESVRRSRVLDELAGVCSEILPQFLYVSSLAVARDHAQLRALGITHVVNCCTELCAVAKPVGSAANDSTGSLDVQTLELALRDDVHEDLSWFFYQVVDFIESARTSPQPSRVLVHCHQGVSRSCALVVAFVMYQQRERPASSFRDAMAFVKRQRPIASPNTAFLCQLIEWERELSAFASPVNTLYRLAPHAAHDAMTLVLKSCFLPEPAAQRQKVVVPLSDSPSDDTLRRWLYTRGIFVFLRSASAPATIAPASSAPRTTVVVWCGRACDIPDGLDTAKTLVEQMMRVRLRGSVSTAHVAIEVVEEGANDAATTADHFGYARELSWIKCDARIASETNRSGSNSVSIVSEGAQREVPLDRLVGTATCVENCEATAQKPMLFVLDDAASGSWERLKVYDSEDLTSTDVFLLVLRSSCRHFLWLGAARSLEREAIVQCAETHVCTMQLGGGSSGDVEPAERVLVEQDGAESDAFWAAFEEGY